MKPNHPGRKAGLLQAGCWTAILLFLGAAAVYPWYARSLLASEETLGFCGNLITEPMPILTNWLAPLAGLGVTGLVVLWRQHRISGWKPLLAGLTTVVVLLGLISFILILARAAQLEIPPMWWMPLYHLWHGR